MKRSDSQVTINTVMVPSKHSTGGNCPVTMTPSLLPLIKHLLTDSTIFHLFDYYATTHSLCDPR